MVQTLDFAVDSLFKAQGSTIAAGKKEKTGRGEEGTIFFAQRLLNTKPH